MTIDTSQRVLIGLTSDATGTGHKLQVNDDISILTFNGTTTGADGIRFIKSRASSPGSNTIVANGDDVGFLDFRVDDGTDYVSRTAIITSQVDGAPGTNDTPGNLIFYTTSDGSSSATERMRIDSDGNIILGPDSGYDARLQVQAASETDAAFHITSTDNTAAGCYQINTGSGSVTPSTGTVSWTIGQPGGTSPRSGMWEFNVTGRHANNGASYHPLISFQVNVRLQSTQNTVLQTGGEIGISYIWDYATDVSFTNNADGTFTITLDIRPYASSVFWTLTKKTSAWTGSLQSVSYT
jgi:hypothetical protein